MSTWRWEDFTVLGLAKQRDRGTLKLHPPYQRDLVHNDKWKRQLIADMVQGQKTIPSIVLRELPDKSVEAADGQQRLDAIYSYTKAASMQPAPATSTKRGKHAHKVLDKFAWARERNPDVPEFVPYAELTPQQQDSFDSYKLAAEVVTGITDNEIRIEFIKRNTSQSPASGGERIHACLKKPGTATAIKEISEHPVFQRATRKRDRHLPGVCLVLFDTLNDITGQNRNRWDAEGLPALNDIDGVDAEKAIIRVKPVLDEIEKVLGEWQKIQEKAGRGSRKVYNTTTLRMLIPQLVHVLKTKGVFTTTGARKYAKAIYDELNGLVPQGSPFNVFAHGLDLASLEATKNIGIFTNAATPDLFRDLKRFFDDVDIDAMRVRDGNCCKHCGKTGEKLYGDHLKPWADGGRTEVVNGQLLCFDCHQGKSAVDAQSKKATV